VDRTGLVSPAAIHTALGYVRAPDPTW
jgi:hypothetical protein